MARSRPSEPTTWLIAELDRHHVRATPWKIERLQHSGLAPRPITKRGDGLSGADLWPPGAVEHYAAVIPLIRQRHAATEIAALTMIGWGYPIDIALLRQAYAKAFTLGDVDSCVDRMGDYYKKRGHQIFTRALAHLRSHQDIPSAWDATDLTDELISALVGSAFGSATQDQIRTVLAAGLPNFRDTPEEVIDWVIEVFADLQREFSVPQLLEAVNASTTEDILGVQPLAASELEEHVESFGGFEGFCDDCNEYRGYLMGLAIPMELRKKQLNWESLVDDLMGRLPPQST
jgi:hypothetical protein